MFLFSLHPDKENIGKHAQYSKGWSTKTLDNMENLAEKCMQHLNSPIVWAYGVRRQDNFIFSDFAVIDVDDDSKMNLEKAKEYFAPFIHVLGVTKSHQQLKGKSVCDRYRAFVLMERRITSRDDYKVVCQNQALLCGGDLQAAGAAMHFMPLKKIISVSNEGRKLPNEVFVRQTRTKTPVISLATGSGQRSIPIYIQRWLDGDVRDGERNLCAFKAACGLRKRGFSEDEILTVVLNSRLPIDRSERVEKEIYSAVRSAMKR